MIRYYITDRTAVPPPLTLLDCAARQLVAGVEMIQLRERDLEARELLTLAKAMKALPNPTGTRILINDRIDVALASGADGVHLRGHAIPPARIRALVPLDFLIGVSCHSVDEVRCAEGEGASFVVLAPIYTTAGKGSALGLGPLKRAAQSVRIPVLALGGVTAARIPECLQAGAAGIAGISLFQNL